MDPRSKQLARRPAVLCLTFLSVTVAGAQAPPVKIHPEMARLEFLVGDWEVHGKTLDPKGEVIREWKGKLQTRKEFGGQMLLSVNLGEDGAVGQRNWKFFNKVTKKLEDVNFDIAGNFEIRRETIVDGDLAFSMVELFVGNDGVARDWRKIYTNITPESYDVLIHHSTDRKKWTLAFVVQHRRPG